MKDEEEQVEDRATGLLRRLAASETLWLAGIPVIAYLTVFSYYSGYFSVFSLPRQLIEFNLVEVFFVSGVILGVAFVVFFWGDLAISAVSGLPDILENRLRRGIIIFIIFMGIMIAIQSPNNLRYLQWFALAGIVLILITELVFPLLTQRKEKGYLNKLKAAEVRREKALKDDSLRSPPEKLLILMRPWLGAAVILLFFVYGIGKYQAVTRKSFYVSSADPTVVVLWMGQERAITARFDPDTHMIGGQFAILEIAQLPEMLQYEEVGPLELGESNGTILADQATPTPADPDATPTPSEQPRPTATKRRRH